MSWIERFILLGCIGVAVAGLATLPASSRPAAAPPAWDGTPQFSMARAWADVVTLATRFPRRWSGGPDRANAAEWIASTLAGMGLEVRRETFRAPLGSGDPVVLENVWGVSPGTERPDEIIIVVGNYDMAPTSYQAASDTAGHAGTILELARLMAAAPHRRTFIFLFPDGEEWGMLGARHFARTFPYRDRIAAVFSIEDLDVGTFVALGIDATGQSRGFAPYWLRGFAADAARREGARVDEVGPLSEWLLRSLLVSRTDQGPFLAVGVQAIDLAGRSDDLALKSIVYHLPPDTIEKMRPASVLAYGRIQERILRGVDVLPSIPRASGYYLRTAPGRIVPAVPLALRQVLVFLPLAAAVLLRRRRLGPLWPAFKVESAHVAVVGALLLAWVGTVKLLPLLGLMPRYAVYPPPPRHPLLTTALATPLLVSAAILAVLVAAAAIVLRRRGGGAEMDVVQAGGRVTVLLLWLLGVSAAALYDNPFGAVTFLLLPALLWIWILPGRGPFRRAANGLLVLLGFTVVVLLFVQYAADLRIGGYILWYVFMALAYAQFTPLQIILTFATLAVGLRLLAVAALGRVWHSTDRAVPSS
jgi:hypothetical protein